MNNLKNSVQLIGRLGKDVELYNFDSGTVKAAFTLATNEYYKNSKGEKTKDTQWHNIVAWGKLAETMKSNLEKGTQVLVKGKLVSKSYEDKEGNKKYVTEIIANEFLNIDSSSKEMPF